MISRRSAVWVLALVVWLPMLAEAAGPAGGSLQSLQQQVDRLTLQYEDLASRLARPTLSHALTCIDPLLATIRLHVTVKRPRKIAYYAVQEQGGNPPANYVTFVEPGHTAVTHEFDVEVGTATRTFLLVAGDTDGNVARAMVDVAPDACASPCPPDVICP